MDIRISDPKISDIKSRISEEFRIGYRILKFWIFGYGYPIRSVSSDRISDPCSALEIVYCGNEIDFCVLRVVDKDIEMNALNCNWDELSFGQKIFSVSTPVFTMQAPEELCEDEVFKHRLNTLWFPMCVGSIAHPWVVGVHPRNEIGELMVLNLNGMIAGASGAPIMNKDGEVVGIYISCFTDPDSNESLNFALRIGSVRDYLKEGPHAKLALDLFGDPNRG